MDGRGGGTTYGNTYYRAAGDPKDKVGLDYWGLMGHESGHFTQWTVVGPGYGLSYLQMEYIGSRIHPTPGCGNVYETMPGLEAGGYQC